MGIILGSLLATAGPAQAGIGASSCDEATRTCTVSPTGDVTGMLDHANLMGAFDEAELLGPGSTVQLTAGTFYVREIIQVRNFSGTFRGVGSRKAGGAAHTVITTPRGPGPWIKKPPLEPKGGFMTFYWDAVTWPRERVASLTVSGFTVHFVGKAYDYRAHWGDEGSFGDGLPLIHVYGRVHYGPIERNPHEIWAEENGSFNAARVDLAEATLLDSTWDDLELIGDVGPDYYSGHNIWAGILLWDTADGTVLWDNVSYALHSLPFEGAHSFTNISVENTELYAIGLADFQSSTIQVDRVLSRNLMEYPGWTAVGLIDFKDVETSVTELETEYNSGVGVIQGYTCVWGHRDFPPIPEKCHQNAERDASEYVIKNNRIMTNTWWHGIELWDLTGLEEVGWQPLRATVAENEVQVVPHPSWPTFAIFSFNGSGQWIDGNTTSGEGGAGIYASLGKGSRITRNRTAQLKIDPDVGSAQIVLEDTMDFTLWKNTGKILDTTDDPTTRPYDGANYIYPRRAGRRAPPHVPLGR
jgi:hypothetical protein